MKVININSGSENLVERDLSNLSKHGFMLDGDFFASVEGLIQGIKFSFQSPKRKHSFKLTGIVAKRMGNQAKNRYIWWDEKRIDYNSKEHRELIERAIRTKFEQNPDAMKALLSTKDKRIIHDVGPESPTTSLPREVFCEILVKIRDEN